MKFPRLHSAETTFVDTPEGIFTASGVWFRTREASLHAYAGLVFDREPLTRLLTQAELWLRSPLTLTLWLLPLLLFVITPLQAVLAALVVYIGPERYSLRFVHLLTEGRPPVAIFRFDIADQSWERHIFGAPPRINDFVALSSDEVYVIRFGER